jgi:hypothetical protein
MRLLQTFTGILLLLSGMQLHAGEKVLIGTPVAPKSDSRQQKQWYYPFEIGELNIKQSNDGTGIIKDVSCGDCDYQFVKITASTKVFVNGKETRLLRARERAGKPVFIEFDKTTAEVKNIYWAE